MKNRTLKTLLGDSDVANDDGVLAALHHFEEVLIRMIVGVWLFLWETVPDFWRRLIDWLGAQFRFLIRLSIRLVRVTAAFAIWLAMMFGPFTIYPGILTFGWVILALIGSIYGLRRTQRRIAVRPVVVLSNDSVAP